MNLPTPTWCEPAIYHLVEKYNYFDAKKVLLIWAVEKHMDEEDEEVKSALWALMEKLSFDIKHGIGRRQ